jgi:hypothetical protein
LTIGLAAFDLENDGDLDLMVGAGDGRHFIYTNDGAGNFTAPSQEAFLLEGGTGIDAYDADHDGDHDLMIVSWAPSLLYYAENLGGGTLAMRSLVTLTGNSAGVGAPPLPGR